MGAKGKLYIQFQNILQQLENFIEMKYFKS